MQDRLNKLARYEAMAEENIAKAISQGNYKLEAFWKFMKLRFSDAQISLMMIDSGF